MVDKLTRFSKDHSVMDSELQVRHYSRVEMFGQCVLRRSTPNLSCTIMASGLHDLQALVSNFFLSV